VTDVIITDEDIETPDVGVVVELDELDQQLVGQLVDRARSQGAAVDRGGRSAGPRSPK